MDRLSGYRSERHQSDEKRPGNRRDHPRGLQFHAGPSSQLSNRRATGWVLEGTVKQRRHHLWRTWLGEWRSDRSDACPPTDALIRSPARCPLFPSSSSNIPPHGPDRSGTEPPLSSADSLAPHRCISHPTVANHDPWNHRVRLPVVVP